MRLDRYIHIKLEMLIVKSVRVKKIKSLLEAGFMYVILLVGLLHSLVRSIILRTETVGKSSFLELV